MIPISILAVANDTSDDEAAISIAADLAHRHGSTARVINFYASPSLPVPFQVAVAGPSAWKWREEDEDEVARAIRALVVKHAARFHLGAGDNAKAALELAPRDETPWFALMRELPLADLVVVGHSYGNGGDSFAGPLGDSLMEAKAPVFVVSDDRPAAGRPAVVAWDGSLEAGRAVRAALPVLKEASGIAILQHVDEIDVSPGSRADPARLTSYLASHDIPAEQTIQTHGRNVGAALLGAAADYGAALLVAGAYGHSRVGEALLGGATRAFLSARRGPHLLLAH